MPNVIFRPPPPPSFGENFATGLAGGVSRNIEQSSRQSVANNLMMRQAALDERLNKIRSEREFGQRQQLAGETRGFQIGERVAGQEFTTGERGSSERFKSEQDRLNREADLERAKAARPQSEFEKRVQELEANPAYQESVFSNPSAPRSQHIKAAMDYDIKLKQAGAMVGVPVAQGAQQTRAAAETRMTARDIAKQLADARKRRTELKTAIGVDILPDFADFPGERAARSELPSVEAEIKRLEGLQKTGGRVKIDSDETKKRLDSDIQPTEERRRIRWNGKEMDAIRRGNQYFDTETGQELK